VLLINYRHADWHNGNTLSPVRSKEQHMTRAFLGNLAEMETDVVGVPWGWRQCCRTHSGM